MFPELLFELYAFPNDEELSFEHLETLDTCLTDDIYDVAKGVKLEDDDASCTYDIFLVLSFENDEW